MSTSRAIAVWGVVLGGCLALGALFSLTGCTEGWHHPHHPGWGAKGPQAGQAPAPQGLPAQPPFQVTQCMWALVALPPAGSPPAPVSIFIAFNRPVNIASLKCPGSARVVVSTGVPGVGAKTTEITQAHFMPGANPQSVTLVSDVKQSNLLAAMGAQPGVYPATFQVLLFGTDNQGSGVVSDTSGQALDGDSNGVPGGIYKTVLTGSLKW